MNTSNNTTKTALILGATGSFGSVMAAELLARGWQVRALQRNPDAARAELPLLDVTWLAGDAMNADDVAHAAAGVQLIVHAVNPPKYQRWRELALPMLNNSIAAARAQNARILLPGVVYNFAPDNATAIPEDAAQQPLTQKGQVRVEMEALLQASGVRILILRAGDYFGGRGTNAWFHYIFKAGKPLTSMLYPGHDDIVHDWAYLPDMASAAAQILERESELQTFERFHFSSYQLSGQQFIDTVRKVSQKPKLPIKRLPWLLIRIAALFASLPRELLEMRYLWQKPVLLDDRRLQKFLGHVPATPIEAALKTSLAEMGIDV
ncbi:NAD(P)H-binding protein [Aquirhabdus sp.]|uniref:NAD(P)H-binding protein n=1 Tax=Aquirhabdus sp. TaxID=2824160 RepID=UPI00396CD430